MKAASQPLQSMVKGQRSMVTSKAAQASECFRIEVVPGVRVILCVHAEEDVEGIHAPGARKASAAEFVMALSSLAPRAALRQDSQN